MEPLVFGIPKKSKIFHPKLYIFLTDLSGMLKAAFIYILHMNLHKHQLYLNYTANPLKFGQQLLGLTLTVNP